MSDQLLSDKVKKYGERPHHSDMQEFCDDLSARISTLEKERASLERRAGSWSEC